MALTEELAAREPLEANVAKRLFSNEPPPEPGQLTVEEVVTHESQSQAERLLQPEDAPEGTDYAPALGSTFDRLDYQARYDGNQADIDAFAEGKRQAQIVLADMRVPVREAADVAHALHDWHQRGPLADDALDALRIATVKSLSDEWGVRYDANVRLAQQAAKEAMRRMPWLAGLFDGGAGNDPALIKRFAAIGLRNARRQRR